MIVDIITNFINNLFACFSKKDTKYQSSTNDCNRFEDLETTYLFEIDNNDNYR